MYFMFTKGDQKVVLKSCIFHSYFNIIIIIIITIVLVTEIKFEFSISM